MIGRAIRHVRQNHALEHATVAMMLERGIRAPLGGYSTPGGYFIFGRVSSDGVTQAATEALRRLVEGQKTLAISPHCGTNLATGAVLAGLLSALIMGRRNRHPRRLPVAAAAIIGATLISRPLGNALQRHYTTLADVDGMGITGVRRLWAGGPEETFSVHRVGTRFAAP